MNSVNISIIGAEVFGLYMLEVTVLKITELFARFGLPVFKYLSKQCG